MEQEAMMNRRVKLIAALMALKLSSVWAQDLTTVEKVQTNPVHADHANRSAQTERKRRNIKPGTESKPTPVKASEQIEATKDMEHGKMTHGSMPGMEPSDMTGAAKNSRHDMNHGGATSGKSGDISNMNHGGGESMSMQGGPSRRPRSARLFGWLRFRADSTAKNGRRR